MSSPTISESARSISNSFNRDVQNLFGLVKPIRKAVSGLIDPETAYADRWYEQGTTGRPTAAGQGDPTGRYVPGSMQTGNYNAWRGGGGGTPPAPLRLPPPITSPNTTFQNADDEYNRLISQYGASGIEQLSGMTSLPTGFTPTGSNKPASLKDYYTAQTLQGSAGMGNIISAMGYKGDMAKWAQANPMLAQREFSKRFGGATLGSAVQPDGSVRGMPQAIPGLDTSKMMPTAEMQGTTFPGQGQGPTFNPAAFRDQADFGTPANSVPAPPMQQGRAVSEPYDKAQEMAAQKTAGATGMPNFQTTPEAQSPGMNFLDAFKKNPQFDAYMLGAGARLGDYFQGIGR